MRKFSNVRSGDLALASEIGHLFDFVCLRASLYLIWGDGSGLLLGSWTFKFKSLAFVTWKVRTVLHRRTMPRGCSRRFNFSSTSFVTIAPNYCSINYGTNTPKHRYYCFWSQARHVRGLVGAIIVWVKVWWLLFDIWFVLASFDWRIASYFLFSCIIDSNFK